MCDCTEICDVWASWSQHKTKFIKARKEYRKGSGQPKKDNTLIVSFDLQKVIMLPRMDQFKTSIFTRRLCLFNETFAEVGKDLIYGDVETKGKKNPESRKNKTKTYKQNNAIIWHEGSSRRKDEDIASAYHKFLFNIGSRSTP